MIYLTMHTDSTLRAADLCRSPATSRSGDSYRIERIYVDSDQAYRFAQAYNGIAPVEPVQVE